METIKTNWRETKQAAYANTYGVSGACNHPLTVEAQIIGHLMDSPRAAKYADLISAITIFGTIAILIAAII